MIGGYSPIAPPKLVAPPAPPPRCRRFRSSRSIRKTELLCPETATRGAATVNQASSGSIPRASHTASAPLSTSRINVNTPIGYPAALLALVLPIHPLPVWRTSIPGRHFTVNNPNGIEPISFERIIVPIAITIFTSRFLNKSFVPEYKPVVPTQDVCLQTTVQLNGIGLRPR